MSAYQRELKRKRDNYSHDQYMLHMMQKGIELERTKAEKEKAELKAKALKEKKEMAVKLALEMLAENEPFDKIARYTKLTLEEIQAL
jgi:oligoribonuclease NrnB/cAMP/cGMP phosphodiesterase (DHH superfamily)